MCAETNHNRKDKQPCRNNDNPPAAPARPPSQVLIIALSTAVYNDPITRVNLLGIVIVVLASSRYSLLSISERSREIRDAIVVDTGTGPLLPK